MAILLWASVLMLGQQAGTHDQQVVEGEHVGPFLGFQPLGQLVAVPVGRSGEVAPPVGVGRRHRSVAVDVAAPPFLVVVIGQVLPHG